MSNVENKADMLFVIWNQSDAIVGYSGKVNGEFKADVAVEPNKDYAKGELKCGFVQYNEVKDENEVVSEIIDVPAFSTNPIPVNSVLVEPKDNAIKVGDVQALKATIEPSNATEQGVTFESSNPDVASVTSDGIVTGISAGEAVITATSVSGQEADTASFTVSADDAPVE